MQESPSCSTETEIENTIGLSEDTMSSLQIIGEEPLDFSDWVEKEEKSKWVARTLKLFLFSQKKFSIINKWCKWPDVIHSNDD